MTPEEAIRILEKKKEYSERITDNFLDHSSVEIKDANETIEMCDMAISALKEIRQYREIDSAEEIKDLLATISEAVEDVDESDISTGLIKGLIQLSKYREIGTVEECREAVEKQNPKKPKKILRHRGGFEMQRCPNCETDYQVDRRYTITDEYCLVCGKLLDSAFRHYCGNCGQAIDENLDGMEDE